MNERLFGILSAEWDRLHILLTRLTLREEAAEELLQELYLRLDRSNGFAEAKNPASYARRAAIHLAMDWRRARRQAASDLVEEPAAPVRSPLSGLIDVERIERVLDALVDLPERQRRVFALRFIESASYQHIAEVLENTPHQARALCHCAITALRAKLEESGKKKRKEQVIDGDPR